MGSGRVSAAKAYTSPDRFSSTEKSEREMIKRFLNDETGMELSEYAVAAALITLTIVGAMTLLGDNITNRINTLANTVK